MKNILNIGVIGAGGRGSLARYAHKPDEGFCVIAGADVREGALTEFKARFGDDAFVTDDYRNIVDRKDIDAVFVTSPDFLHEEHAVAALEAGKAVYLEKPMAITVAGCDRILETARRTGARLYVGHNMRHFAPILTMKRIIDSGEIGEIRAAWCRHFVSYGGDAYFRDWHSERRYSTGLLLQKGAHDIDVIHWLVGAYSERVVGMGTLSVYDSCARRSPEDPGDTGWHISQWPPEDLKGLSPVIDVEDHSMILMELSNGVTASYLQCHYTPDATRNYTFIGTKGRVENLGDHGACRVVVYNRRTDQFGNPDVTYDIKPAEGSHGGSDPVIVSRFLAFVTDGTKPNTSPIAARQAVATGVAGTESIRNGSIPKDILPLDESLVAYFENGQHEE